MKKLMMIYVVVALIFTTITPSTSLAAIIGIDSRHGCTPQANLATGNNFDTFRSIITGLGHTIVQKSFFDTADLVGLDALILYQPYMQNTPAAYSPSEISAIHALVNNGKGLIVHSDGGTGSDGFVSNLNALVAPYGVTYASEATQGTGYTITDLVPHPVTNGVSSFGVDYQRREISITSPAIDLTTGSGANNALAVVNGVGGAGNVVLLSDAAMWADPDTISERPITFGDSQLLLQNIIQFTVPEPATICLLGFGALSLLRRKRSKA